MKSTFKVISAEDANNQERYGVLELRPMPDNLVQAIVHYGDRSEKVLLDHSIGAPKLWDAEEVEGKNDNTLEVCVRATLQRLIGGW
jgi:hypothetical protein